MNRASFGQFNLTDGGGGTQSVACQESRPSKKLDFQSRSTVPILMYHRVATSGPPGLERFRVDPVLFDEQVSAIRLAGFQTIKLNDWIRALSGAEDLPGKPIILTFDDGYRDFLSNALPTLRKYSSTATVYLVAGRIGGIADWDSRYGEAAPLMSWEELGEVGRGGVELGCHSLDHRPMTEMKEVELLEDTRRAREILELGLGHRVSHFAYPYGAENSLVRSVVADLGFCSAVSCRPGLSQLTNDPLNLPRIEVTGNCTPEELTMRLTEPQNHELVSERPEASYKPFFGMVK